LPQEKTMTMNFRSAINTLPLAGLALLFCVFGCQPAPQSESQAGTIIKDSSVKKIDTLKTYNVASVDNRKDPTCGMPLTAGINDTAHYKNKVIGFCSAECKAEFVKNPAAGLLAAELKK
jgi:YHS domain-containing protein